MSFLVKLIFLACLIGLHAGTIRPKIEEVISENNLKNNLGTEGSCSCDNPFCCPSSGFICTDNCPDGGGEFIHRRLSKFCAYRFESGIHFLTSSFLLQVSCVVPMILLFAVANLADVVVLVTLVARQKIAVALFLDSLSRKRISCQATQFQPIDNKIQQKL